MAGPDPNPGTARCSFARWMVVVLLGLTAAISLVWSHNKLMSQDEIYSFQTDSLPSVAQLVRVQRMWPISLDPLLYHLLSHAGMKAFGPGAFALRLPSLLGFLLMQVCLYFFVRILAGDRAGMIAAVFPALTATEFYAVEGRPYGLMLGLYALALLCWQAAARSSSPASSNRRGPLFGLVAAIALIINAHYFGMLLLIPLCAAEAVRTFVGRRLDWPMLRAIALGTAGIAGTIPFLSAAREFKNHYYNTGTVGLHDLTRAYRSVFVDYTQSSIRIQHGAMFALVVFAVVLVWGCLRQMRSRESGVSAAEWAMLLTLAALPFCGLLLARIVTHSIEVRYVLGAVVAIAALLAVAIGPWLRHDGVFSAVVAVLLVAVIGTGIARVRAERRMTAAIMASLALPPNIKDALERTPDRTLYIQDMGVFETASYYEPDADVRTHLTLVYSQEEELRWDRHDTMSLTATHMQHFTGLPIAPYDAVRARPGEHLFVMIHSGWNWTDEAFAMDARLRPVGQAMQGNVVAVKF